jgi:glycine/D-amino acid oxidase-like deaminating enzyme
MKPVKQCLLHCCAVGSSREFSGWQQVPHPTIISAIMDRAVAFLPDLTPLAAAFHDDPCPGSLGARVGLRPFALGGLPVVGWVPGLPGVVVAAGHEGSGLCLGPATADLVVDQVLLGGGLRTYEALAPNERMKHCITDHHAALKGSAHHGPL